MDQHTTAAIDDEIAESAPAPSGETSARSARIMAAVWDAAVDGVKLTIARRMHDAELGDAVRLSVPDGRGGWVSAEVTSAAQAIEYAWGWQQEFRPDAHGSYRPAVGMVCTVSLRADRWPGVVVGVSPSAKTVEVAFGRTRERLTFRLNVEGRYRAKDGIYGCSFGTASEHTDPHV